MLKYLTESHSEKVLLNIITQKISIYIIAVMLMRAILLTAGFPLLTLAQHVIDLSGDNWTVKNAQGNASAPASLPSQVHLDLYAAGVIREYYSYRAVKYETLTKIFSRSVS